MLWCIGLQQVCGKDWYGVHAEYSRVNRLHTLRIPAIIFPAYFLKGEIAPGEGMGHQVQKLHGGNLSWLKDLWMFKLKFFHSRSRQEGIDQTLNNSILKISLPKIQKQAGCKLFERHLQLESQLILPSTIQFLLRAADRRDSETHQQLP